MRICVVDDHPMVLEGVTAVLGRRGHQTETASDIGQATKVLAERGPFDLLLLDYFLPSGKGPELLQDPAVDPPEQVVILSAMQDPEDILFALEQTTAKAYILKLIDLEDLAIAVEQIAGLQSGSSAGHVWDTKRRCFIAAEKAFPSGTVLTRKEREVFMHMRQGLQDKQIADRLGRSIHTVRVQVRSIKRKRGHSRRAEVIQ